MIPPPRPASAPTPTPRFAALHTPDYRRYFILSLTAMTADNIEHVISYWVIYQAFHSPMLAGFAVISHWMPFLLFSVYAGALADRYDCRKLIQAGQILFMVASLSWGLLFLTGTLRMWHAVAILLIHGAAGVTVVPATQLILHDMVGRAELQSAIRLNATARYLAILLGPAVGGGLMLLLGPAWGLLANVLIYAPFSIFLWTIPYTGHLRDGAEAQRTPRPGLGDMLRVFGQVRGDRRIVVMIVLGGVTSFFVGNAFQAQMPEYAHHLGTDDGGGWYSLLLAANAVGAILGTVLLESSNVLRPGVRSAIACAGVWGARDRPLPRRAQLSRRGDAAGDRRRVQHRVRVDGADAGPAPGAAARARGRGRPVQHGDARPPGGQRPHRGRAGGPHQRAVVARAERHGRGGERSRAASARNEAPRHGAAGVRHGVRRLTEHGDSDHDPADPAVRALVRAVSAGASR